jgi:RimJ/RimL family protein N-acetyltransferase
MSEPELSTERLLIRPVMLSDAGAVFAYRSLPEVSRFQTWLPTSVDDVTDYIRKVQGIPFNSVDSWFPLAVCLRSTGELIGDIGLHFLGPENLQVEIGFTISPVHQRNGFAYESTKTVLDYVFTVLRKHRVIASIDPGNVASLSLAGKLGMRKEAHFRKSLWIRGEWVDDVIYAVRRDEWEA